MSRSALMRLAVAGAPLVVLVLGGIAGTRWP